VAILKVTDDNSRCGSESISQSLGSADPDVFGPPGSGSGGGGVVQGTDPAPDLVHSLIKQN
jgi:hypothetical protein